MEPTDLHIAVLVDLGNFTGLASKNFEHMNSPESSLSRHATRIQLHKHRNKDLTGFRTHIPLVLDWACKIHSFKGDTNRKLSRHLQERNAGLVYTGLRGTPDIDSFLWYHFRPDFEFVKE